MFVRDVVGGRKTISVLSWLKSRPVQLRNIANSFRPPAIQSLTQLMLWATAIQLPVHRNKLVAEMDRKVHDISVEFGFWDDYSGKFVILRFMAGPAYQSNFFRRMMSCSVGLQDCFPWSAAIRWISLCWSAAVVGCANANICDDVFDCFLFIFAQCNLFRSSEEGEEEEDVRQE